MATDNKVTYAKASTHLAYSNYTTVMCITVTVIVRNPNCIWLPFLVTNSVLYNNVQLN